MKKFHSHSISLRISCRSTVIDDTYLSRAAINYCFVVYFVIYFCGVSRETVVESPGFETMVTCVITVVTAEAPGVFFASGIHHQQIKH